MIVKDESRVITRCLSSLLPIIDYWVIVDTGSTDGTQQIIKDFMDMKGIPGELHERPWVDFSHNRNEALQLAKGKSDYVFFIDADEYLTYDSDFRLPELNKDYYYVSISHGGSKYSRIMLIKNDLDWRWSGVLHEVLTPYISWSYASLEKVTNTYTTEGVRSRDPQKYQKDAQVLEAALQKEPENRRYVFYLAQSYRDAGDLELALKNYEKRANMGGWDQEVFWSLLEIGKLKDRLERPIEEVLDSYKRAYQYRKSRVEPLYYIAQYYRSIGEYESGYKIAKLAQSLPRSQDVLFIQQWMLDYGIPLELSVCAYWIGDYGECQKISMELLQRQDLPEEIKDCVAKNLQFANWKLFEKLLNIPKTVSSRPSTKIASLLMK
jgi:glycosyltransferase involved in cell wall biosynthesis